MPIEVIFSQKFSGVPKINFTIQCKVCLNLELAVLSQREYREIKQILTSSRQLYK